jgi:putative MATE family efflux protein
LANSSLPLPGSRGITSQSLNREIIRLAIPAVLENLLATAVLFVDTLLLGRLDDPAVLAAAGISSGYLWISQGIFIALGVGALAVVARAWGEGDVASAQRIAGQAVVLSMAVSLIQMALMMLLAEPFLRILIQDPDPINAAHTLRFATEYSLIILSTSLLANPRLVISSVMRAAGDTRTPMWITLLVNVINIGLAVPLIYGMGPVPALGIQGAGLATAIAQALGGLIALVMLLHGGTSLRVPIKHMLVWHWVDVHRIWRLALPNILESGIQRVGFITFIGIVSSLGTVVLAAHQIANTIESMAFMPAWGVATATSTLVGQALGARDIAIAELATKRAAWLGFIAMLIAAALFAMFAEPMAAAFGAQGEVLVLATLAVRLSGLELPGLGLYMIFGGALRGAGDTRSPMIVSLIGSIVLRVSVVWVLAIGLGLGLAGVWIGTAVDWAVRAFLMFVLYKRGHWTQLLV